MSRNVIYDAQIYDKLNKENKEILNDYILELKAKGRSKGTITQYSADIKMFFCWLYINYEDKYILKLKKRDFRRFFLEIQESGASPARTNRVQCSIRNLLEFACADEDEYDYSINMMKSIKGLPKEEVREIIFLTDEQITLIIDKLLDQGEYQMALYLSLSYDSAGRRNEVAQVKKTNFLKNKTTNIVIGKRGKKFPLLYFSRTREIAEEYFEQRGNDDIESLWIIQTSKGKDEANPQLLYGWTVGFRTLLEELTGELIKFNPHSFRHSSLTNFENGTHHALKELGKEKLPLEVLKVLAHHSDISTTQSYLPDKDGELLAEAFGL